MASTYLTRTESSGNRKTGTLSFWVKRSGLANGSLNQYVYSNWNPAVSGYSSGLVQFSSADRFEFANYQESGTGTHTNLLTNRLFRDTSAWYHIVVNWDTTQATSSDRYKMYINGVQETSFQSANYPSLNEDLYFNIGGASNPVVIGSNYGPSNYFDGSMSHYHWIDGTAYDASAFGETDANGVWKIIAEPSVTYGTNGFFILKDGNSVTDQSGNGNNFTVGGGTLTNTEDNPSNVFATFNNLIVVPSSSYSNGNTKAVDGAGAHKSFYGTLGFSSGKYYWEAKAVGGTKYTIGLSDVENYINYTQVALTNVIIGESSNSYGNGDAIGWYFNTLNKNGSAVASSIHTIVTNDIMMIACDADNGKIYYGVNGTWRVANSTTFNSADNDTTFTTGKTYAPAFSAENCGWEANFGNGYFGTTAVSSAGTNASGIGIFEYDVPTGYTALSTKGLNL